jgi:hypothetical protein
MVVMRRVGSGFFCEGNGCGYIFGGASVGGEKESTVFFLE